MRLFWKVFAVLWLATLLVGGSGFLVSRALQQDWLLLQLNPELRDFAAQLTTVYEQDGAAAAQVWLEAQRRENHLRARLFDAAGDSLLPGTLPRLPRFQAEPPPSRPGPPPELPGRGRLIQLAWNTDQASYIVTLHVPAPTLWRSQRAPVAMLLNIGLALTLLTLLSLVLSRYLTRPLRELGSAAQSLAKGEFKAASLQKTAERRDEIGELARRFESMAEQVQSLLDSQQQLLRDVSHELRSPLARLRVGLALGSQKNLPQDDPLWQRLDRECDRLDQLIDGILTLSRLDTQREPASQFELDGVLMQVVEDARFSAPDLTLTLTGKSQLTLTGWPDQLAAAFDNLLRNAVRFSPEQGQIDISVHREAGMALIRIDDQGPGVAAEWLGKLGEPFVRVPGQRADSGYGLGLTIARRAVARHGGRLSFSNNPAGGLRVDISLPTARR
ncbi:HAMP domain-containing sensor histidine kinase [Halopseudomonas sp.]|uniref:HAMP domain-containing sensor histidine kinase n=1 Tax=Halopseudomonas sp. TaxID=2901191 RepID=UPI00311DC06A